MSAPVHILATCRKPELAKMTTLVFATLRVGFPSAQVTVYLNGDCELNCPEIVSACTATGCQVITADTIHHEWIKSLVQSASEPFWILDTDVILYASVEGWSFDTPMAGRRIPEWDDEFSKCITRPRLHTSLLYLDPARIKAELTKLPEATVFTPKADLFNPLVLPLNQRNYFYDTAALLYHQLGGQSFTPTQLDAFFHFNFGTIEDVVLPTLTEKLEAARASVLKNPAFGKGRWREQDEYYAARQYRYRGEGDVAPPTARQAEQAVAFTANVCCGDRSAVEFCNLWYHYCHGIDDLLDTMTDGRPVLKQEEIIRLFFKAAILFNSDFFVKHRGFLFPIVLQTTNTYADSVAWEKSSKRHLRQIGDVFRTCGNEMFFMVALLCGGLDHMRSLSPLVKEGDWLGQHDKNGQPT